MILENDKHIISVSIVKVYENCIKDNVNETHKLCVWLPNISHIAVNDKGTIIKLKGETEEINLGFTAVEWIINDYINSFYE